MSEPVIISALKIWGILSKPRHCALMRTLALEIFSLPIDSVFSRSECVWL